MLMDMLRSERPGPEIRPFHMGPGWLLQFGFSSRVWVSNTAFVHRPLSSVLSSDRNASALARPFSLCRFAISYSKKPFRLIDQSPFSCISPLKGLIGPALRCCEDSSPHEGLQGAGLRWLTVGPKGLRSRGRKQCLIKSSPKLHNPRGPWPEWPGAQDATVHPKSISRFPAFTTKQGTQHVHVPLGRANRGFALNRAGLCA